MKFEFKKRMVQSSHLVENRTMRLYPRNIMKNAIITGITGQDGRYLSKLLIEKNYRVIGLIAQGREATKSSFEKDFPDVELQVTDFQDSSDLDALISRYRPDEFYNLVAASSVKHSFQYPFETAQITAMAPVRILEVLRNHKAEQQIRFYQASSSEMFGDRSQNPKSEESEFAPKSPYAIAKLFAHQSCELYREAYGLYVSCGILFNHESVYRSEDFVSRKITREIARIVTGKKKTFNLGALTPRRDWGFAGDYVEAMWLMLQHDTADNYVVATGESHSVLEFVTEALKVAGLPNEPMEFVRTDPELTRPLEIEASLGDSTKARSELGWRPKVTFEKLVEMMVMHDIELETKTN